MSSAEVGEEDEEEVLKNRRQEDLFVKLMTFLPHQATITRIDKEQLFEKLISHISSIHPPRDQMPLFRFEWNINEETSDGEIQTSRFYPSGRFCELFLTLVTFLPEDKIYDVDIALRLLVQHFTWLHPYHLIDNNYRLMRTIRLQDTFHIVWAKPGETYEQTLQSFELELASV